MPYFIVHFKKPRKHRAGQFNIDVGQVGGDYPNLHQAELALCELMDKNRYTAFLRIERNVLFNSVVYADLDQTGGVVRFRQRDEFHFSSQIPLREFKRRLARKELALKRLKG